MGKVVPGAAAAPPAQPAAAGPPCSAPLSLSPLFFVFFFPARFPALVPFPSLFLSLSAQRAAGRPRAGGAPPWGGRAAAPQPCCGSPGCRCCRQGPGLSPPRCRAARPGPGRCGSTAPAGCCEQARGCHGCPRLALKEQDRGSKADGKACKKASRSSSSKSWRARVGITPPGS